MTVKVLRKYVRVLQSSIEGVATPQLSKSIKHTLMVGLSAILCILCITLCGMSIHIVLTKPLSPHSHHLIDPKKMSVGMKSIALAGFPCEAGF